MAEVMDTSKVPDTSEAPDSAGLVGDTTTKSAGEESYQERLALRKERLAAGQGPGGRPLQSLTMNQHGVAEAVELGSPEHAELCDRVERSKYPAHGTTPVPESSDTVTPRPPEGIEGAERLPNSNRDGEFGV